MFVTNGPLLKPSVEGELPGHVFQADAGAKLELEIGLTLSTREPISYLEIIKDGHVEHEIRVRRVRQERQAAEARSSTAAAGS